VIKTESMIRVRYADTDQMRIVHHAKYFEFFEIARSDLLRSIGMGYGEVESRGYFLPVIEAQARFHKPAYYDELLVVEAVIKDRPGVKMKIEYEVRKENDTAIIARGYTIHGFINSSNGLPAKMPEFFEKLLQGYY
jgi:acyl-CoA thioester hydrolase